MKYSEYTVCRQKINLIEIAMTNWPTAAFWHFLIWQKLSELGHFNCFMLEASKHMEKTTGWCSSPRQVDLVWFSVQCTVVYKKGIAIAFGVFTRDSPFDFSPIALNQFVYILFCLFVCLSCGLVCVQLHFYFAALWLGQANCMCCICSSTVKQFEWSK